MPLKKYGVLVGRPVDRRLGTGQNPHFQVHLVDDQEDFRIAINVRSQLSPPDLEYIILDRFNHPLLGQLRTLSLGYHPLESRPGGMALDFIRGNLFRREDMRVLPFEVPGPDNDLNERVDSYVQRSMGDENSRMYAFGERWGPENKKDKIFGFSPGNGIHDIHMNQGNSGRFAGDNGVYQDGGLIFYFPGPDPVHQPEREQWVAIFLKFQSQEWHTVDTDGSGSGAVTPVSPVVTPPSVIGSDPDPQGTVRIVAAMVNSQRSPEAETITLLNAAPTPIDLGGWSIKDKNKHSQPLSGTVAPGATVVVEIDKSAAQPVELSNKGGIISLIDAAGLKVDGVSYSKEQASHPGWTVVFRG